MNDNPYSEIMQIMGRLRYGESKHKPRLWVVGDAMLDEYWSGDVERLAPEGSVAVFRVHNSSHRLGGAANVAHCVVALGGDASLAGVVGSDEAGKTLYGLCEEARIDTRGVVENRIRPTTRKVRLVTPTPLLRLDIETADDVEDQDIERSFGQLVTGGPPCGIILSDYAKGMLTRRLVRPLIELARSNDIPLIVDPKGKDVLRFSGASWMTPNLGELAAAINCQLATSSHDDIERAARQLSESLHLDGVLVTMGAAGMLLVPRSKERLWISSSAREVVDVTGAGDTVVAAFTIGLVAGLAPASAARLAGASAGVAVAKDGVATVSWAELVASLAGDEVAF